MKVWVIARDKTGVRHISAYLEHEGDDADRTERVARGFGYKVERVLGADLRGVVLGNEGLFEERAA